MGEKFVLDTITTITAELYKGTKLYFTKML